MNDFEQCAEPVTKACCECDGKGFKGGDGFDEDTETCGNCGGSGHVPDVRPEPPYTPSPWRVGTEDSWTNTISVEWLDSRPGRPGDLCEVCTVHHLDGFPPGERGEANARLIAAAPELLESLESLLSVIEYLNALPNAGELKRRASEAVKKAKDGAA